VGYSDYQHNNEQWIDLIGDGCLGLGFKTKSASDLVLVYFKLNKDRERWYENKYLGYDKINFTAIYLTLHNITIILNLFWLG
jgi:hypothetical protein